MKYHITKDGEKIKIAELKLSHLKNIIKFIEKKAKEGFVLTEYLGLEKGERVCIEEEYYGEKAKKYFKYYDYKKELKRRNELINN